jgi:hypothetical protein
MSQRVFEGMKMTSPILKAALVCDRATFDGSSWTLDGVRSRVRLPAVPTQEAPIPFQIALWCDIFSADHEPGSLSVRWRDTQQALVAKVEWPREDLHHFAVVFRITWEAIGYGDVVLEIWWNDTHRIGDVSFSLLPPGPGPDAVEAFGDTPIDWQPILEPVGAV